MTPHCQTCTCGVGDDIPPPATSSAWARRQAIAAAREAVHRVKRQRTATHPPGAAGTGLDTHREDAEQ